MGRTGKEQDERRRGHDAPAGDLRREFRDAAGRLWVAREFPIPASEWTSADEDGFYAGYGVGWLCFESEEWQRYLRLYPKQWHRLSDAGLQRLFEHARNASAPRRWGQVR